MALQRHYGHGLKEGRRQKAVSRRKAIIFHLGGTVSLMTILTVAIYAIWFPEPFGQGLGLWRQMLMLWLLPLGAGPLLTIVLFKPGKAGLKFDIGFIAAAQAVALSLSVWMIYQARPVFAVFAVDRFEIVQPGGVVFDGAEDSYFTSLPFAGPVYVVAELPTDPKENTELLFSAMDGGGDVHNFAKYYRPYVAPHINNVIDRAKPIRLLLERDVDTRKGVVDHLGIEADIDHLMYLPMMMRESVMSAVIDPSNGRVVGVLPVTPN